MCRRPNWPGIAVLVAVALWACLLVWGLWQVAGWWRS